MTAFSILDLTPVTEGSTVRDALHNSLRVAQLADARGFERYWFAEHHNMVGVGSAAVSVVAGFVAQGTERIRVGSGGVMLPNHAPLLIAEQFGTLAELYPGRIDLGVGRAPGTDQITLRALRRQPSVAGAFPDDVAELLRLLDPPIPGQRIVATPGAGTQVPVWILGSSTFGARLAAQMGLPYAFASHFAPKQLMQALAVYHQYFRPSGYLDKPYAIAAANATVADTREEAEYLFTTAQQVFAALARNERGHVPPPVEDIEATVGPAGMAFASGALQRAFLGTKDDVRRQVKDFIEETQVQEVMICEYIYDQEKRRRSYELFADAVEGL